MCALKHVAGRELIEGAWSYGMQARVSPKLTATMNPTPRIA